MNEQTIALTLLTMAETGHAFSAFEPSYFTIRTFALEGDRERVAWKVANLRSGYVPAVMFGLGLGAIVSWLARSPLPLLGSAATVAFMVWQYERALPAPLRLDPLQALVAACGPPALPGPATPAEVGLGF